jgi:16S rRNA processing protein RimM
MGPEKEPWDLVVGRVVAPFGIKGEVRVRPETDSPERFARLRQVCLELPDGEERLAHIRQARVSPKGVLLLFQEYTDRDQASQLRGAWIRIRPSMALPLPEGAYYIHQLIGLRAFTVEGLDLGEITEVIRTPANDVYVTPRAMIPALRQVVREVDLEGRRMVVELLPEEETKDEAGA